MNKKIYLILAVAVMAIVTVSAVSAANSSTEKVTIGGLDFEIPDGYTEDVSHETVNETKDVYGFLYTMNGKLFKTDDNLIVIFVSEFEDLNISDDYVKVDGGVEKTINNQSGYLKESNGFKVFVYPKDQKIVAISTNNESILSDFVA